jgi:hypothetical protein
MWLVLGEQITFIKKIKLGWFEMKKRAAVRRY